MVEMKIIIDCPGGVYPVIANSVEEVETELKLLINQFCELKEPPFIYYDKYNRVLKIEDD
jgi:hypothetical protein